MKYSLLSLMFSFCLFTLSAQVSETSKAQMIKDWERAKSYTIEYMDAVPADKYDFKAQDSVRSFAQQLLHLAQGNLGLGSAGTGKQSPLPRRALEQAKSAQSKDSVAYFVKTSYDFIIDGIKGMDLAKFDEKAKLFNFEETRSVWLNKTFEHQTHHRGQMTLYIRLLGIKPPNEKLF